jgi:hypothetical protein
MESKKINQLATELAPVLSDLTIIGDPTTGISKKITLSQMASLFTGTVEEYPNLASFPLVGTADTIYIALDTNIIYRWNTGTSAYVELSPNIVTSLVFSDANGFDGTISLVGSTATLTITTALTQGSVPFIGTSGALTQDNANLFFDDTNNRLGINTNSPTTALDVFGSGIIGRINGTSTNNAFLGFASAGTNKWSIGNVQSDHRFRIYSEANTSELVSVLQTGEFGIGIANPTTKLHIDGGASALIANLDANVSVAKSVSFRSDNSARINLEVSGTESGSNAGADLFIRTYTDAGALLATPITLTRSTGAITLSGSLTGTTAVFAGSIKSDGVSSEGKFIIERDSVTTNTIIGSLDFTNNNAVTTYGKVFGGRNSAGDGYIALGTGVSNNLYALETGNVGIGVASPAFPLEVYYNSSTAYTTSSRGNAMRVYNPNTGSNIFAGIELGGAGAANDGLAGFNAVVTGSGSSALTFYTRDSGTFLEKVRISAEGRLGVGTNTPSYLLDVTPNNSTFAARIRNLNTSTDSAGLIVQAGVNTGNEIALFRNAAGTDRVVIFANGNTSIGSSSNVGRRLYVLGGGNTSASFCATFDNSGGTTIFALRNDGYIQSPTTYNNTTASGANVSISSSGYFERSTSSIRFKTNIEDLTIDTTNILSKMRPIWYRSLGQNDRKDWSWYGFIAEELAELEPRLVNWGYDESSYEKIEIIDEEGNIKQETKLKEDAQLIPDGVQYERITVLLVAELQKMRKELDDLKAK